MVPIETMLDLLPERQRDVVIARYRDGLTGPQTAERLRINDRRQRQLLAAARRRLARHGMSLPDLKRGRRAGTATPASQFIRNRAGKSMNLDTLHAA